MEKRRLTTKNKYCMIWISITISYFLGFYMWFHSFSDGDYAGLAVVFLFLLSAPIFSIITGWLVYKGTNRIFLPNIITVGIMILISFPQCIINVSEAYAQNIRFGYPVSVWELLFDGFSVLLIFGVLILAISSITSTITRAVILKRNKNQQDSINN